MPQNKSYELLYYKFLILWSSKRKKKIQDTNITETICPILEENLNSVECVIISKQIQIEKTGVNI